MPENVNWTAAIQVTDGPALKTGGNLALDSYSKVQVTLENEVEQKVNLRVADSDIILLFVRADQYGDPSDAATALLYRVNNQAVDKNEIVEMPIFLLGKAGVSLLTPGLQSLTFTNNTGKPVTLDIVVGMDVTPEPSVP